MEVDPAVEGLRLRVDKRRFERVMANLVENAALYAGGVTRVMVGAAIPPMSASRPGASGSSWRTRAPGCPPADRDHLFERFYRGGRAGQRESSDGTGLGLSLVAEHVRLHGGRVWIEDAPGPGIPVRRRAAPGRRTTPSGVPS